MLTLVEMCGAPWRVLPPGIHATDLKTVRAVFAFNARRRALFAGLVQGARDLRSAGCKRLYVDGSYVTSKPIPGDFDVCWDPEGVVERLLDPCFRDFSNGRAAQKNRYGGEFFPSSARADRHGNTFLRFFQLERFSGGEKGVVLIDLIRDAMFHGAR